MSFSRFLTTISDLIPLLPLAGHERDLSRLNPDKFYLENVRSVLGMSSRAALLFCNTAVRQGVFLRGIEVICPDGSVAASAMAEETLPETVTCWSEDAFGDFEPLQYFTRDLNKVAFYRFNGQA